MKKSLIVGHHPISNDIERQLRLLGSDVEYGNLCEEGEGGKCIWDIIFLLANPEADNAVDEDLKMMNLLIKNWVVVMRQIYLSHMMKMKLLKNMMK